MPILEPSRPRTIIHWIQKLGIEYIPSQANFILTKPGDGRSLFLELQKQGVITRALGPTLADYLAYLSGLKKKISASFPRLNKHYRFAGRNYERI